MQDIQVYLSHPAIMRHFTPLKNSSPRNPFKTPEKKSKPCNHAPERKSARLWEER